jgi:hypothetical protein
MLIFNYGNNLIFSHKIFQYFKIGHLFLSKSQIYKNFPNTFFILLYNKLKFLLKESSLFNKMGIYSNGKIFGLRIYNFNDEGFSNTLFEEKYVEIMSHEQMREAYLFYNEINDKNNIYLKIYSECSSTLNLYNKENFMEWYPISLNNFLEQFGI